MAGLDAQKTAVYMIWMIGMVAGVAAFMLFLNYLSVSNNAKDIYGAAVEGEVSASSRWTSCLDQGNKIKLSNDENSLMKTDTCLTDGSITRVSCLEDQYGYFTYDYTAAQSCSQGKKCAENAGIGSCQ